MGEEPRFFDRAKISVKGGDGGNGCVSFRREKFVPRGGPNGGDGGRGGDVYLRVDTHQNTLISFKYQKHFKAGRGGHGKGNNRKGKHGEDVIVDVPPGTVVRDADTERVIADLTKPGQEVLVAEGGRGGRGNASFTSATNQAPRMAEKGEPGQERWLHLELKLIADVGIIGAPNAGKSTLLAAVSAARPKIAAYPFTTITPNLGVAYVDGRDFVLVDIPGLIEGAHEGVGLGDAFLRHVERTRVLIHLLDGAAHDPLEDFEKISEEIGLYRQKLLDKPQIVVLNKTDLPQAREIWPLVKEEMERHERPAMKISAVTGEGVEQLLHRAADMLESVPKEKPDLAEIPVLQPGKKDEDRFAVRRVAGDVFRVEGAKVERLAVMTDWENEEAISRFQRAMGSMGVTEALKEAGVEEGDTVRINDVELEWA